MVNPGITVCIPTIPPRSDSGKLGRAIRSAYQAALMLEDVTVHLKLGVDMHREGAARTRDQALLAADTEWVAFLDDDDEMYPRHLLELWQGVQETGADYLWSRFWVGYPDGRRVPGPKPLGAGTFAQWDDDQPAQTTVTTLVRRELALDVGGFSGQHPLPGGEIDGQRAGEDWLFTLACRAAGGKFHHVPEFTWVWHHHESNTSGLPSRW